MPELPEVNTFQRYFDQTSLHQKIERVEVHDDKIIRNMSGEAFIDQLNGRTFTGSYRRGKYLFAKLDNDHDVLLHFGMTGDLKYYQEEEDRPRHERFVFHFTNGFRLGFDCPRKFARILYLEDRDAYIQSLPLGEYARVIKADDFEALAEGRSTTIKGFLLNQRHLAGVGNLYADEVCYQTRIHPASKAGALSKKKLREIHSKMQEVLRYAVERNAYYKDYPEDWLWQWREEGRYGPDGKSKVLKTKVAGRTTYFAEGWQKLYT